jgi:hypothetical protein
MRHGAGGIGLHDLRKFFLRLLVPERMQQCDAACKRLLHGWSARNRKMHGPQLLRSQIVVVMAFLGQGQEPEQ